MDKSEELFGEYCLGKQKLEEQENEALKCVKALESIKCEQADSQRGLLRVYKDVLDGGRKGGFYAHVNMHLEKLEHCELCLRNQMEEVLEEAQISYKQIQREVKDYEEAYREKVKKLDRIGN